MTATAGSGRLVALRALGLGDLLTAVPALRALERRFPAWDLVLAAPDWLRPLVPAIGPSWRLVHTEPLGPLHRSLDAADLVVNMHGQGPHSHRISLAARPARLWAYRHPAIPVSPRGPRWSHVEHEVSRWCRLVAHYGTDTDPDDLDLRDTPAAAVADDATLIHVGAKDPARQWQPERWASVARHELQNGRNVIVTAGRGERSLAETVRRRAAIPVAQVFAGTLDVGGLASVVAASTRVASCDTGVAHLAVASRRPSVVLFGDESPERWGPPTDRPWHRVVRAPTARISDITPAQVMQALATLPRAARRPRKSGAARRSAGRDRVHTK